MLPYWIKAITKEAGSFKLPEKAHNRLVYTQIKILNTCAYLLKSIPDQEFGQELVNGIMGLFKQVTSEQVDLRRELLVAVKYSFANESIRNEYMKSMTDRNWFFDHDFMLGKSTFAHTVNLRTLLCELQVLFITQSRNSFDFEQLLKFSNKISENINDPSLEYHIVSC